MVADFVLMGLQEAVKCMRHSKRSILTTDDVNSALSLRNVEVILFCGKCFKVTLK
jgi:histone H3/H4